MKIEPPQSLIKPGSKAPANRTVLLVFAIMLAVFSGWHVFNLPFGLIRRNTAPPDLSGKAYGLRELWIDEEGTWTIKRVGYADRRELYKLTAENQLWREYEAPVMYEPLDISGIAHGSPKLMEGGYLLDVKASPRYWQIVRGMRRDEDQPRSATVNDQPPGLADETVDPAGDDTYPLPSYTRDTPSLAELPDELEVLDQTEPAQNLAYVPLEIYQLRHESWTEEILESHEYYPSMDSWAYVYPDLWITTNNQQWLHHLAISVDADGVRIGAVTSLVLDTTGRLPLDCVVGFDPVRDEIFMLRADGYRCWFKPDTLAYTSSDNLPGVWEQEFATIAAGNVDYVYDNGYALTRPAYQRMMRVLMVLFLASLLVIATVWRKAWRSTSAATIAASNLNGRSSTT